MSTVYIYSQYVSSLYGSDMVIPYVDMLLKLPNIKDLRILRLYSKSIETKSYYGPHSNKVVSMIAVATSVRYIHHIQVLNKPSSEQECSKVHEPYALHKKIRSRDCKFSEKILAMEEKFERLLSVTCRYCRYTVL